MNFIWQLIVAYLATWIIAVFIAALTRKTGYGSMFYSAAHAVAMNLLWPLWVLLMLGGIFLFDVIGPAWDRIERWWDSAPTPEQRG